MINITNSITITMSINSKNRDDKMNEKDKDNITIINCINKNLYLM
jgi:hypothetical protein